MGKIITLKQAEEIIKRLKNGAKTVVLAGGCFDILHLGHLRFLEKAKKEGDILLVALEHDETIKRLKGKDRPINPQKDRARILSALKVVDYVVLLPPMESHADYFSLVKNLKPDVIAVTSGDPHLEQKKKQARVVGGEVRVVTPLFKTPSTTKLLKLCGF